MAQRPAHRPAQGKDKARKTDILWLTETILEELRRQERPQPGQPTGFALTDAQRARPL